MARSGRSIARPCDCCVAGVKATSETCDMRRCALHRSLSIDQLQLIDQLIAEIRRHDNPQPSPPKPHERPRDAQVLRRVLGPPVASRSQYGVVQHKVQFKRAESAESASSKAYNYTCIGHSHQGELLLGWALPINQPYCDNCDVHGSGLTLRTEVGRRF